jgi:hypothetical protein
MLACILPPQLQSARIPDMCHHAWLLKDEIFKNVITYLGLYLQVQYSISPKRGFFGYIH